MRSVLVFAFLLVSSLAHAQAPGMTPPIEPATQPQQSVDQKNPSTAVLLSLGIPLAGIATMGISDTDGGRMVGLAALYFGPSTGQWYAGKVGGLGLGLRAVGAVSMVYGFVKVLDSAEECDFDYDGSCAARADSRERAGAVGAGLMWAGAGLWVGSSIYDIVLAKRAADSWNARHNVTLSPGLVGTSGTKTPGLFVSARF